MGYKSTTFNFQIIKLLQGTTNVDARFSNIHQPSGSQSFLDCRVDVDAFVVIENATVVVRTPSETRRRDAVQPSLGGDVAIYEIVVCAVIVICCIVIFHTLQVILQ